MAPDARRVSIWPHEGAVQRALFIRFPLWAFGAMFRPTTYYSVGLVDRVRVAC